MSTCVQPPADHKLANRRKKMTLSAAHVNAYFVYMGVDIVLCPCWSVGLLFCDVYLSVLICAWPHC